MVRSARRRGPVGRARGVVLGLALLVAPSAPSASAQGGGDDPAFAGGLQWGLTRVGLPDAWERATGRGVTIAIIDSGADLGHVELRDRVSASVSCIGASGSAGRCQGSAQDDNGHGTHVAGIIGAATGNGTGVAGVAPGADLMVVRVLANECTGNRCTASGRSTDVSAGIRWAVDHGADVINLSLGGGTIQNVLGCPFCDAVRYAWSQGVISVVAAGNDALLPPAFAGEPAVIVTATTRDDRRSSYSNPSSGLLRDARWPVAAPGGEGEDDPGDCAPNGNPKGILSTYWLEGRSNEYACLAGTSMAAPHVTGALALLLEQGYGPAAAIDRLLGTADDLGPPGRDPTFGVGRINVARATSAAPAVNTTTTTAPPPDTTSSTVAQTTTTPVPSTAPTTQPPPDTTEAPPPQPDASLPDTAAAAPFTPRGDDADQAPGWLVAIAAAAALAAGAATSWWARQSMARR